MLGLEVGHQLGDILIHIKESLNCKKTTVHSCSCLSERKESVITLRDTNRNTYSIKYCTIKYLYSYE